MITLSAEQWTSGEWANAIAQPYVGLFGEPLVGTILAGSLILAFWVYSGDIVMPAILTLLLGGVLTAVLPGQVVGIARTMVVVGMATAFLAAARRYIF